MRSEKLLLLGGRNIEQALAFAALNASLNARENMELRLGSFLEPVAGEPLRSRRHEPAVRDLTRARYLFRDSGMGGDLSAPSWSVRSHITSSPAALRR